jgi:hypothetical protein
MYEGGDTISSIISEDFTNIYENGTPLSKMNYPRTSQVA